MPRSIKKGPFIDKSVSKWVARVKAGQHKGVIKTWARRSTITPDMVGITFAVHNGKAFNAVFVTENMVGHKLGEFSLTRKFTGHSAAVKTAEPAKKA